MNLMLNQIRRREIISSWSKELTLGLDIKDSVFFTIRDLLLSDGKKNIGVAGFSIETGYIGLVFPSTVERSYITITEEGWKITDKKSGREIRHHNRELFLRLAFVTYKLLHKNDK